MCKNELLFGSDCTLQIRTLISSFPPNPRCWSTEPMILDVKGDKKNQNISTMVSSIDIRCLLLIEIWQYNMYQWLQFNIR